MIQHRQLPDAGRRPHDEIDLKLPTLQEKKAIGGHDAFPTDAIINLGQAVYFLMAANAPTETDGNWRIIAADPDLVVQVRVTGTWNTITTFSHP